MRFILLIALVVLTTQAAGLNLTEKEKNFISTHKFKCITTAKWAPFNTYVNGRLDGIAVQFWKLVAKKLHLKYKCIIAKNWSEVLNAIKNKKADLTVGTTETKKKSKYAIFSIPYAKFPYVIATRNNIGYIDSMVFLKGKTIAVGKNYAIDYLLKKYYPNYKILEVQNTQKALEMVNKGKAFAAIDVLPVIVYHINKYQFSKLKISGKTPWNFSMQFMIRNDYPLLKNAINKAILSITDKEKKEIYYKWISLKYERGYTLKEIITVFGITLIIIGLLLIWIYGLKKEIKKRISLEKQLQKLSLLDSLTGIYNRYKTDLALKEFIDFAARNDTPLSIIFFDIDRFKKINDNYGHSVGDDVLRHVVDIIKKNIRKYDIFGRWGGEEFIIILPNTDLQKALNVAEKLKQELENSPHKTVGRVTCSFGVTEFRKNDNNETMLIRADNLMYEAKKAGRNTIISDKN